MTYRISSEVRKLRPGYSSSSGRDGSSDASNKDELLFDDILWTSRGQKEHDVFAQALRDEGAEVLYLDQLLAETLQVQEAREWVSAETFEQRWYGVTGIEMMREYADSLNAEGSRELFIAES